MIRIHIITQNEPFYIPKMIHLLINGQNDQYKIVSYTVLNPSRKNKTILSWIRERTRIYTYIELIIVAFLYVYVKVYSLINRKNSPYSCKSFFTRANIIEIKTNDINSDEYLSRIKMMSLDLIVSISCPQLFGKEILNIPKIACINAHGTLLPKHRGVFGSFWTLFCGDLIGGATLHTMVERLDAGQIVWQQSFPITIRDTQYSIAYKTKLGMAKGLIDLFRKYNENSVDIIPIKYETSYHRAPSRNQGKEFHKKGFRIIRLRDSKLVLAKAFDLSIYPN